MKQLRKTVVIIVFVGILLFVNTGYLLIRPGSAEDLSNFVNVSGREESDRGIFYLVTVSQQKASPVLLLYGLFDPIIDVEESRRVIPPGMDPLEYQKLMEQWMEDSQNLAKVIALKKAGYDVPIKSDGIEIVEVGENSPAKGILFAGDVITRVDDQPVYLAEELITHVQSRTVGEPVVLTVDRNGETKVVTVNTTNHSEQPDKAAILVLIQTLNWQPELPLDIQIEVGEISGPSAGMMFVLEILNQLNERDLTSGKRIAGTGTINLQEEVGAIGGVRQKVRAAEAAGAEYFLVPQDNYQEAKSAARDIRLISVETLDEALNFLEGLAAGHP